MLASGSLPGRSPSTAGGGGANMSTGTRLARSGARLPAALRLAVEGRSPPGWATPRAPGPAGEGCTLGPGGTCGGSCSSVRSFGTAGWRCWAAVGRPASRSLSPTAAASSSSSSSAIVSTSAMDPYGGRCCGLSALKLASVSRSSPSSLPPLCPRLLCGRLAVTGRGRPAGRLAATASTRHTFCPWLAGIDALSSIPPSTRLSRLTGRGGGGSPPLGEHSSPGSSGLAVAMRAPGASRASPRLALSAEEAVAMAAALVTTASKASKEAASELRLPSCAESSPLIEGGGLLDADGEPSAATLLSPSVSGEASAPQISSALSCWTTSQLSSTSGGAALGGAVGEAAAQACGCSAAECAWRSWPRKAAITSCRQLLPGKPPGRSPAAKGSTRPWLLQRASSSWNAAAAPARPAGSELPRQAAASCASSTQPQASTLAL
mmetsp:Transcript_26867/g.67580  ORF Transcript_26867/g.67580 Transcript_26867/m.67580 type:complete len:435 (+) Transcript_26867:812-2116(+)